MDYTKLLKQVIDKKERFDSTCRFKLIYYFKIIGRFECGYGCFIENCSALGCGLKNIAEVKDTEK